MLDQPNGQPFKRVLPANCLTTPDTYHRGRYFLEVPNYITMDDLLTPAWWANHTRNVKRRDLIEVMSEDDQLDVVLRVMSVEPGMIHMRVHYFANGPEEVEQEPEEDDSPLPTLPDGYKVGFNKEHGHYVKLMTTTPPEVIITDLDSVRAAHEAAVEHAERARG